MLCTMGDLLNAVYLQLEAKVLVVMMKKGQETSFEYLMIPSIKPAVSIKNCGRGLICIALALAARR